MFGKPKNSIDEFRWKRLFVKKARDGFGGKFGFCCIFYNNTNALLFAEGNLNNMADFE